MTKTAIKPWGVDARPETVDDMLLSKRVLKAIDSFSNVNLISGPSGSGKTTLAGILAKEYDAEIISINAGSDNGIDKMREILERIKFQPMGKSVYMVVVDEAHALTKNSINAMLTTLENNSKNAPIWMMMTDQPEKLPLTAFSRLNKIVLEYPPMEDLVDYAYDIAVAKGYKEKDIPVELMEACASYSGRNVRLMLNTVQDALKQGLHKEKAETKNDFYNILKVAVGIEEGDTLEGLVNWMLKDTIPNLSVMTVYSSWSRLLNYHYFAHIGTPVPTDPFGEVYFRKLGNKPAKVSLAKIVATLKAINMARSHVITGGVDGTSALITWLSQSLEELE